jgi:sugar lactone lactonase YvrE
LLTPDGAVRRVADGLVFPNGMAVTPDDSALIAAEFYGNKRTALDIAEDGGLSNRRAPTSATAFPTASAWTRRAPSGTQTS